jgi:hypothetical protein
VVQVVVQGLTVLVDAAILVGDVLVSTGVLAATSSVMVALTILGALLAIIGLAIMFALLRADITKKQEPLLDTVGTFLRDTAHKLLKTWDSPPPLSLTYDVPKTAGSAQSLPFSITATNKSEKAITLNRTTMTLEVGGDDACLFSTPPTFTLAADPDPATLATRVLTPEPRSTTLISYDFAVAGPRPAGPLDAGTTQSGPLVLSPNASLTVTWHVIVNKVGSTTLQIIETLQNGDKCRFLTDIGRAL